MAQLFARKPGHSSLTTTLARPRFRSELRLALLAAACAAILVVPTAASAKSTLAVGFLDNADVGSNPSAFWDDAVALRVGFMRWDMQWSELAATKPRDPRNPADPHYDFGASDQFVRAAAAHGLQDRVMFTLWKTPNWASSTKSRKARATQMPNLTMWRAFVFACAKRYSGTYTPPGQTTPLPRVRSWETWNEPNAYFAFRPQYSNGVSVSPRNYVKLLTALRSEVNKAVKFKPTFVAGAMYKQGGSNSLTPVQFMRGMQAAGARFDVLSMHPYNRNPSAGIRDGAHQSTTNPSFIGVGNFQTFITLSNQIFHHKYPIWITEFGLPTAALGVTKNVATFRQQSRFVSQALARLKALPQVDRAAWYLVKDEPPRIGAWYTTGLRKDAGAKKPSYNSWMSAARKLHSSPIH